jgi:Lhr-like helicase
LRSIETVIVDEIHALVSTKRGAHMALSLERLERITKKPPQRIGLSATAAVGGSGEVSRRRFAKRQHPFGLAFRAHRARNARSGQATTLNPYTISFRMIVP